MPQALSPGVYIEEAPSGPVPIQGVSTSTAGFVGCTERGPLQPTLVTSWLDFERRYGGLPAADEIGKLGYLAHGVQGFFENGGTRAYIARVTDLDSKERVARLKVTNGKDRKFVVEAIGPGNAGGNMLVKISEASQRDPKSPSQEDLFAISVIYHKGEADSPIEGLEDLPDPDDVVNVTLPNYRAPAAREFFDNLSLDPERANYVAAVVNGSSQLIRITKTAAGPFGDITAALRTYSALTVKKPVAPKIPEPEDYEGRDNDSGDPADWTGLKGLGALRDISILCIPDQGLDALYKPLSNAMQAHCEASAQRFAIAQFMKSPGPVDDMRPPIESSFVAIYYPWLGLQDLTTGKPIVTPPSGHIAGIYARNDDNRGVHKAPANEVVTGLILNDIGEQGPLVQKVTKDQQAALNPSGINCIRDFRDEGQGVRVWGARTTSSDGQWRYVNVRRLFIFVEQSIDIGMQWVVFEPNEEPTWERVVSSVSSFLSTLWKDGALMGSTPEEAFFVRCDRTTMSQDDIDEGRLIAVVGIAPVKPAEFIIFRIAQKTADAEA